MIGNIIKFYEVGKELGLTKKEINQIMIFDNSKNPYLWRLLLFVVMFLIIIGWFNSLIFIVGKINENVYPAGALYSTVKLRDFKKKRVNSIIVDVRSNPGGLLNSVVDISDFFFDRIEQQLKDKHDIEVPVRDTTKAVDYKN